MSLSDLEIARRAKLVRIESLGESLGLLPDESAAIDDRYEV